MKGAIALMASFAVALSLVIVSSKAGWAAEEIDDEFYYSDPAMAVDSVGGLHVVSEFSAGPSEPTEGLAYFHNCDGAWQSTLLYNGRAVSPAIAVDSNNCAHVVYAAYAISAGEHGEDVWYLNYGSNAGGEWSSVTLDVRPYFHQIAGCGIAIDKDDKVHLCYSRMEFSSGEWSYNETMDNKTLVYISDRDGIWNSTSLCSVAADGANPWRADIATDGACRPYVTAKRGLSDFVLLYSETSSGSWNKTFLSNWTDFSHYGGAHISIGAEDDLHVFYQETSAADPCRLIHAERVSGTWEFEAITGSDYVVPIDCAFDDSESLHVLCKGLEGSDSYARVLISGHSVEVSEIDLGGYTDTGTTICLSGSGTAYVPLGGDSLGFATDSLGFSDRLSANALWVIIGSLFIAAAVAYAIVNFRIRDAE